MLHAAEMIYSWNGGTPVWKGLPLEILVELMLIRSSWQRWQPWKIWIPTKIQLKGWVGDYGIPNACDHWPCHWLNVFLRWWHRGPGDPYLSIGSRLYNCYPCCFFFRIQGLVKTFFKRTFQRNKKEHGQNQWLRFKLLKKHHFYSFFKVTKITPAFNCELLGVVSRSWVLPTWAPGIRFWRKSGWEDEEGSGHRWLRWLTFVEKDHLNSTPGRFLGFIDI